MHSFLPKAAKKKKRKIPIPYSVSPPTISQSHPPPQPKKATHLPQSRIDTPSMAKDQKKKF